MNTTKIVEIVKQKLAKSNKQKTIDLAKKTTNEDTLKKLSKSPYKEVLHEVARNKNTPKEVLKNLAQEYKDDTSLMIYLIDNKNLPKEELLKFQKSKQLAVQDYALGLPLYWPDDVDGLMDDKEYEKLKKILLRKKKEKNLSRKDLEKILPDIGKALDKMRNHRRKERKEEIGIFDKGKIPERFNNLSFKEIKKLITENKNFSLYYKFFLEMARSERVPPKVLETLTKEIIDSDIPKDKKKEILFSVTENKKAPKSVRLNAQGWLLDSVYK